MAPLHVLDLPLVCGSAISEFSYLLANLPKYGNNGNNLVKDVCFMQLLIAILSNINNLTSGYYRLQSAN